MSVIKANEDQFEVISDVQVKHRPTGAAFSTYRYEDPTTRVEIVHENTKSGQEVDDAGDEYDMADVRSVARDLLQQLAERRSGSQ